MNSPMRSGFDLPTACNNTDQFFITEGGFQRVDRARKEPVILNSMSSGSKHMDLGSDLSSTLS